MEARWFGEMRAFEGDTHCDGIVVQNACLVHIRYNTAQTSQSKILCNNRLQVSHMITDGLRKLWHGLLELHFEKWRFFSPSQTLEILQ